MDKLAEKLFECEGEVIVTHEDCALVLIKDGNHICYVSSDICLSRNLKVGDTVMLNARIAPKECVHPEIPYLCRALWNRKERVPSHLFPRMLERFQVEELEDYIRWATTLQERIPSEFDKFIQKEDISALGGLLAMQGIIEDAPLRKKPEKEPSPELTKTSNGAHEIDAAGEYGDSDHQTDHHKKKKKRKKKKKKKDSAASESEIEIVEEKMPPMRMDRSSSYQDKHSDQEEEKEWKKDKKKKKRKQEESSPEEEVEEEESSKKKKKKDKKKKEKKSKKKKKRKHSTSEDSDLEIAKVVKKKHKIDVDIENIPHHLVLHKLNDMIHELEKGVDPEQLQELLEKDKPGGSKKKEEATAAIAYPKIGEAYDPKAINTWSNMRGFQSVAATKSSWLGLTVAPGAQPSIIPEPKISFGKQLDDSVPVAVAEEPPDNHNDEDNTSGSTSKDSSPKKDSMFKNIFGEEREPSPENNEDEIIEKAYKRKEKPDANQKTKSKSNNLAMALQSRLNKAASGTNPAQNDDKQSMDRQSMERPYHKPSYQQNNSYDKHKHKYNQQHNRDNNKRSRSRSQSYHNERYNKQKQYHDRNNRFSGEERYNDKAERYANRYGGSDGSRRPSRTDTDSRQSLERSKYETKGSRQSSDRSRYDTKASSRHQSRNKSRSRGSSSSSSRSKSSRSSIRKKLTGSVSRENSSSGDSDSDNNSKKRNLKRKSKLKKIKEEKSKKKKPSGGVKMNYSDEDKADSSSSSDSDSNSPSHNLEDTKLESDHEDDDKMIERIRKQRARLVATLPSADRELQIQQEVSSNKNGKKNARGAIQITSFQQEGETKTEDELKDFKTVILSGSVLTDGDFSQVFQISASVQGLDKSYYQCSFPELLKKSNSLNFESKKQLMETLQLKSSKFDVSREGLLNVYYKHPKNSSAKTVTEKDLLLGLLIFLQGLDEPVVLFVHSKDSLLPTLIAKMNHYKLFDHFVTIVVCCCDMSTLAWNLRMDTSTDAKQCPSLRVIAESVNPGFGKVINVDQENASSVLGNTLDVVMKHHKLSMQRVIEMSNKMTLAQYMNLKINIIQGVREELENEKPDYVEIIHSHQAYGDSTKVDLVWNTLEDIKKMLKGSRGGDKRSTPSRDNLDTEEQVKSPALVKSRVASVEDWERKTYNCFLAPGNFTIKGKQSLALELRVPALQLRLTELRGKSALVEKHPDFSLCHLEEAQSSIEQSATSLFPIVSVTFRNSGDEALTLNSKEVSGPIATVKLAVN